MFRYNKFKFVFKSFLEKQKNFSKYKLVKKKNKVKLKKKFSEFFIPKNIKKKARLNYYFCLVPVRNKSTYPYYRIVVTNYKNSIVDDLGFYDPFNNVEFFTTGNLISSNNKFFNSLIYRKYITINRDKASFWLSCDFKPLPTALISIFFENIALIKIPFSFYNYFILDDSVKYSQLINCFYDKLLPRYENKYFEKCLLNFKELENL